MDFVGSDITEMKMHRSEPALKHSWRGNWEPDAEKKHISVRRTDLRVIPLAL